MGRVAFALSSVGKLMVGQNTACPNCDNPHTQFIQRKKLVLQLRHCDVCGLLFRYPKENVRTNWQFYQNRYFEPTATDLPDTAELPHHVATGFRDIARDSSARIAMLKKYKAGGQLLNYGCSWGYEVHQLRAAGFDAVGFEISRPRAEYGRRNLDLTIYETTDALADRYFDVIYASHVLEHIPDPKVPFAAFRRLLRPDGLLVVFVPNGGGRSARALGTKWGPMINEKHVLALTGEFFNRNLPRYGLQPRFASSPYVHDPVPWEANPDLEGDELMVLGRNEWDAR